VLTASAFLTYTSLAAPAYSRIGALLMVKEVLTPEQVQQRMEEMFAKMGHGDCGPIAE